MGDGEINFGWSLETLFSARDSIFSAVHLPSVTEMKLIEPAAGEKFSD